MTPLLLLLLLRDKAWGKLRWGKDFIDLGAEAGELIFFIHHALTVSTWRRILEDVRRFSRRDILHIISHEPTWWAIVYRLLLLSMICIAHAPLLEVASGIVWIKHLVEEAAALIRADCTMVYWLSRNSIFRSLLKIEACLILFTLSIRRLIVHISKHLKEDIRSAFLLFLMFRIILSDLPLLHHFWLLLSFTSSRSRSIFSYMPGVTLRGSRLRLLHSSGTGFAIELEVLLAKSLILFTHLLTTKLYLFLVALLLCSILSVLLFLAIYLFVYNRRTYCCKLLNLIWNLWLFDLLLLHFGCRLFIVVIMLNLLHEIL